MYNCVEELIKINHQNQNNIAYICDDESITYFELFEKSKLFGISLLNSNIKPKQQIIICLEDSIDFVVCFLGCLYVGIIPILINSSMSKKDIDDVIIKTDVNNIICSTTRFNDFSQKEWNLILIPNINRSLTIDNFISSKLNQSYSFVKPVTYADDDAFILCTSGTTGQTKLVLHSQKSICGTGLQYGTNVLKMTKDDVVFSAAKMTHAYGLGNSLSIPMTHGSMVVLCKSLPTADKICDIIEGQKVTVFCGVPRHYTSLINVNRNCDFSRVRISLSAGESLPKIVGEKFKNKFCCDIIDAIGSTETLGFFLTTHIDNIVYGVTGIPVGGVEIKLLDEYGDDAPEGYTGEMYVKSEYASKKYLNDEKATKFTFNDGWIKTGDMYQLNRDGYYIHKGRINDCIKVNGLYVSLPSLENDLYNIPSISEAAVVATENKYGLNVIEIYVVLKQGYDPLQEHLNIRFQFEKHSVMFKRPFTVKILDSLPRTQSGKIKKYILLNKE
jgi:benzoate-CoA ligase